MGNAPGRLPANGGKGFFDSVKPALAADLVMGNLEQPLTDDTGTSKCGADSHQLLPVPVAAVVRRAPEGRRLRAAEPGQQPRQRLRRRGLPQHRRRRWRTHGLKHTGAPDQITVVEVKGVKVAVVGFSSYAVEQQPDRHPGRRKR